jgi:hypothetical protein
MNTNFISQKNRIEALTKQNTEQLIVIETLAKELFCVDPGNELVKHFKEETVDTENIAPSLDNR